MVLFIFESKMSIVWLVFFYALITAVATWLWAVPFAFIKKMPPKWLGIWNAIAAALMIAASFWMIEQWLNYSAISVLVWVLIWVVFILVSHNILKKSKVWVKDIPKADFRKILLIIGVMTLHSFAEGIAIGVSFGPSIGFGLFIAIAMAVQNIPEWLAISLVTVPRGMKWRKAWLWSIFSSLPQPLMAVPAYMFVRYFEPVLPFWLGFAAGAMLWMSFSELMPEAVKKLDHTALGTIITVAIILMILFQWMIG